MKDIISNLIKTAYNINALEINQVQGGWTALAYSIASENMKYFLKVFDKHRHTSQSWIKNIDYYIPIILWLHNNTQFGENLIIPVFTDSGAYKCENEDHVFILYPYINGITLADKKLTCIQQRELAKIVAQLHLYGQDIPDYMPNDVEDFNISFCDTLLSLTRHEDNKSKELKNAWTPYKSLIAESIEKLNKYAKGLIDSDLNFVLCHTDIHGWNLMQADRLMLIDWEGLKLAPAEADLFAFSQGFFFHYARDAFISAYKEIHPTYTINQNALDFYRLRRRLEDITEFAESVLYDNLSNENIETSLKYLIKECSFL